MLKFTGWTMWAIVSVLVYVSFTPDKIVPHGREAKWDKVLSTTTSEELAAFCAANEAALEAQIKMLYGVPKFQQNAPSESVPQGNPLEQPRIWSPIFRTLDTGDVVALCGSRPSMRKIVDKLQNLYHPGLRVEMD